MKSTSKSSWLTDALSLLIHARECCQACRAATKDRHCYLFWASFWMVPQVCCRILSSPSTVSVWHQVFLGRAHLHFPSGVQCRAVQVMLPCSLWVTCLIHLHRLHIMMVSTLSWLQWARSCWLEMVSGQKISRILLRFFVWKVDNLFTSHYVILKHSEPYSRLESTQLWYSLSLVLVLYWDDLQTCSSFWRRFWPCWGDSWCCCPLHHHVWQCCQGTCRWTPWWLEGLLR